jgi:uroporphyrinogen decarboxylase
VSPSSFNELVLASPARLAMPIAVYPGASLTGAQVRDLVNDAGAQVAAEVALHERYHTPVVLSAMDLSAEAEAFGCELHRSPTEVPSVIGRLVTNMAQARALAAPKPGDKRTRVYLETVRGLKRLPAKPLVLAGCIGPFSLASRLAGMTEALELTLTEPDLMHVLIEKSAEFLSAYVREFHRAGADGILMAEPAAGLLSPRAMSAFSSAYLRRIREAGPGGDFTFILHNCAARPAHLPALLETGFRTFHFGAPMDLTAAVKAADRDIVFCGNLDPAGVFCSLPPDQIKARATALLATMAGHRNYVLSSGCDVPPNAPLSSLDAFYDALRAWNAARKDPAGR